MRTTRSLLCAIVATGVLLRQGLAAVTTANPEGQGILDCLLQRNSVACAKTRLDGEIDRIEFEVSGKRSETPMSVVLEEAGSLIGDGLQAIFGKAEEDEDVAEEEAEEESRGLEEARRKKIKFGKKKKQALQKFLMIAMLLKAKLSLILQLISTHFQMKFFVIAVTSLLLNAARFWIDLKKGPGKVIYYEHAQHQHHYDHDEEPAGYWARSSDEQPEESLPYSGYSHGR